MESVLILAIVFLLLLVFLVLIDYLKDPIEAKIAQSRIYWSTTAYPIQLEDWYLIYTVSADRKTVEANLSLLIHNPTEHSVLIKEILIDPGNFEYVYSNTGDLLGDSDNLRIKLNPGERTRILLQHWEVSDYPYIPEDIYILDVSMLYDSNVDNLRQVSRIPIMGKIAQKYRFDAARVPRCPSKTDYCPDQNHCCPQGHCYLGNNCCLPPDFACGSDCCKEYQYCDPDAGVCINNCEAPEIECGENCCKEDQYCNPQTLECQDLCLEPDFTCANNCCPNPPYQVCIGLECSTGCRSGTFACGSDCCDIGSDVCDPQTLECIDCPSPNFVCGPDIANQYHCCSQDLVCINGVCAICPDSAPISCNLTCCEEETKCHLGTSTCMIDCPEYRVCGDYCCDEGLFCNPDTLRCDPCPAFATACDDICCPEEDGSDQYVCDPTGIEPKCTRCCEGEDTYLCNDNVCCSDDQVCTDLGCVDTQCEINQKACKIDEGPLMCCDEGQLCDHVNGCINTDQCPQNNICADFCCIGGQYCHNGSCVDDIIDDPVCDDWDILCPEEKVCEYVDEEGNDAKTCCLEGYCSDYNGECCPHPVCNITLSGLEYGICCADEDDCLRVDGTGQNICCSEELTTNIYNQTMVGGETHIILNSRCPDRCCDPTGTQGDVVCIQNTKGCTVECLEDPSIPGCPNRCACEGLDAPSCYPLEQDCNATCTTELGSTECVATCLCENGNDCSCVAETDEIVEFVISDGQIIPYECYSVDITVIGSAIQYGDYDVPVTVKLQIGSDSIEPWGDYDLPVDANINDDDNPRTYSVTDELQAGTAISITGRSWIKRSSRYSGTQNWHWRVLLEQDSHEDQNYVWVLRDGDDVPDVPGFEDQDSIQYFVQTYVVDGKISLGVNQAIFLFELGTTNLNSDAADFQDIVIIASLEGCGDVQQCNCSCSCDPVTTQCCEDDSLCCATDDICLAGKPGLADPLESMIWLCCPDAESCGSLPSDSISTQEHLCCPDDRVCDVSASAESVSHTCCPQGSACVDGDSCCEEINLCGEGDTAICCTDEQDCVIDQQDGPTCCSRSRIDDAGTCCDSGVRCIGSGTCAEPEQNPQGYPYCPDSYCVLVCADECPDGDIACSGVCCAESDCMDDPDSTESICCDGTDTVSCQDGTCCPIDRANGYSQDGEFICLGCCGQNEYACGLGEDKQCCPIGQCTEHPLEGEAQPACCPLGTTVCDDECVDESLCCVENEICMQGCDDTQCCSQDDYCLLDPTDPTSEVCCPDTTSCLDVSSGDGFRCCTPDSMCPIEFGEPTMCCTPLEQCLPAYEEGAMIGPEQCCPAYRVCPPCTEGPKLCCPQDYSCASDCGEEPLCVPSVT